MVSAGVFADWTGGGFGSGGHDDLTANVVSYSASRGSDPEIVGSAQAGSCTLLLNSPSGIYNPSNASSPIHAYLHDGIPLWIGIGADGTFTGSPIKGIFGGRIAEISPLPVAGAHVTPQVEIVCDDALTWYGRQNVNIADSTTRSQGDLRQAVLDAIGETRLDLDTEIETLPLSSASGDALSVLTGINAANGTRHFIRPGATAADWYTYVTANRMSHLTGTPDSTLDTTTDIVQGLSGWRTTSATVINEQTVQVAPVDFPLNPAVVWTYPSPLPLVVLTGSAQVLWANFADYVGDAALEIVSAGSALTATLTSFGTTAKIELSSAGSSSITTFQITGRLVERLAGIAVVVDDAASQAVANRGVRVGPTIQGDYVGTVASAQGIAGHLIWRYASPLVRPSLTVTNWLPDQFDRDLFDVIAFTSPQLSVSALLMEISGLTHQGLRAAPGGPIQHTTTYVLAESRVQSDPGWFVLDTSTLNSAAILGY